ncbi:MAG: ABC transporter substrate-binding protein [Pseudomonadota bacterium]
MTPARAFAAWALLLIAAAAPAAAAPARVVSMNLCTDQLAMLLAAPGQLVSVTWLAQDPSASAMAEEAAAFPANRGFAEEIFLLQPDLVIAGAFTTRATVDMLRRLDVPVVEFAPAASFDEVRDRVRQMGAALGRETEAEQLVARFDADLAAARPSDLRRPRAASWQANGWTAGPDTLAGAVIDAAGLANVAEELGLSQGGALPLERLVTAAPDLIVTGRPRPAPSLAEEAFSHPAMAALRRTAGAAPVADRHWICGTPFIVEAVRRLAAARAAVLEPR